MLCCRVALDAYAARDAAMQQALRESDERLKAMYTTSGFFCGESTSPTRAEKSISCCANAAVVVVAASDQMPPQCNFAGLSSVTCRKCRHVT